MMTFVSKVYGGKSSDSFITINLGFLNLLEPGNEIMVSKLMKTLIIIGISGN